MSIFKNMRWVAEDFLYLLQSHTKVFVPSVFWCAGIAYAVYKSVQYMNTHAHVEDFIGFILNSSFAFILFNLLLCPILVISNLWVLNILKQANNQKEISVGSAFLHAIGFKMIMLLPFVLIWMGMQFLFICIFAIVMFLAGLSRGNIGGSIIGKLIGGFFTIVLFMTFFLYMVTPGMVLDDKNMFSSARQMMQYVKKYAAVFKDKFFAVLSLYLLLTLGLYGLLNLFTGDNGDFDSVFVGIYLPIVSLIFIYYLQIKAGQFYIWSIIQDSKGVVTFEPINQINDAH